MKLGFLHSTEFIHFTTRDFAIVMGLSLPAASKRLQRLAQSGTLVKVTRGVWANPEHPFFNVLGCVPPLLGQEQGYVSFLTALHLHGIVSQIPATIQIATTGHGRKLKTPIGSFEWMQMSPQMLREGIEWSEGKCPYRIASAEKALLDTLYLATRRGRRFASLPELECSGIKWKAFDELLKKQVRSPIIRKIILQRSKKIRNNSPSQS